MPNFMQLRGQSQRLKESRDDASTTRRSTALEDIGDIPSQRLAQNRDWLRGDDSIEPVVFVNRLG